MGKRARKELTLKLAIFIWSYLLSRNHHKLNCLSQSVVLACQVLQTAFAKVAKSLYNIIKILTVFYKCLKISLGSQAYHNK